MTTEVGRIVSTNAITMRPLKLLSVTGRSLPAFVRISASTYSIGLTKIASMIGAAVRWIGVLDRPYCPWAKALAMAFYNALTHVPTERSFRIRVALV